jgi:anti-anti-sigma factor
MKIFSLESKQNQKSTVFIGDEEASLRKKTETKRGARALTELKGVVMLKVNARNLGNVAVLSLQGQIVIGETATLRDAVQAQAHVSTVVLDLAGVSTIDARGLGVMLELREQVQANGIGFKIMNPTRLVSHVLEITCLDSVFEITPEVDYLAGVSRRRPVLAWDYAACA